MYGNLDNIRTERTPCKCFRCGSEDNLITKFLKPHKENEKEKKQVCFNEKGNRASQKECDNLKNNNDQNIYTSTAHISNNDKCPSRNLGKTSQ